MYNFLAELLLALVWALLKKLAPPLVAILMKRKSPEIEKQWREATKQGLEWDHLRDKPKDKK